MTPEQERAIALTDTNVLRRRADVLARIMRRWTPAESDTYDAICRELYARKFRPEPGSGGVESAIQTEGKEGPEDEVREASGGDGRTPPL